MTTYAHDAHCNVIHQPGPQECPPHCDDGQHISAEPCPSCGSTVQPNGRSEKLMAFMPLVVDPSLMRSGGVLPRPQPDDPPEATMTDDVVHVGLNEGPPQHFTPYDGADPDGEFSYPVPRAVWDAYAEAERQVEAAEDARVAALKELLAAIQAVASTDNEDEDVHRYRVVTGWIYYP